MIAGSPLWQLIFVSFALVLILFEVIRGWRLGLVRQVIRLFALICAYATAVFGGRLILPIARPIFSVPDFVISLTAGAILALLVYFGINLLGGILFKRTGQQGAGLVRILYGACGAVLGVFFGCFSVWLIVVAIRSIGALANAEMHNEVAAGRETVPATTQVHARTGAPPPLIYSLAKLKNSIELGPLGETVRAADVVPDQTYQTLGKLGTVVSNPESAERFLSYPGAKKLTENPRITALRNDPEIIELVGQQRFLELLQNPKVINALNDPELAAQVRNFDFQKALDYAMKNNP